jgi:hypothetical protein
MALLFLALSTLQSQDTLWMDACIFCAVVSAGSGVLCNADLQAPRKALYAALAVLLVCGLGAGLRDHYAHSPIPNVLAQ